MTVSEPLPCSPWFVLTRKRGTLLALLLLACVTPALWAGDAPFIGDEPQLIAKALQANALGRWETLGLLGTRGRSYGPLPVWLYQIALSITHDAVTLVRWRAALFMAVTLGGLAWALRLARLPLSVLACVAGSPFVLLYARMLWDNSFNIPLAAVATALSLHVRLRRALWPVPVLAAVLGAMLLVHLMAGATVAAVGVFVLVALPRAWRAAGERGRAVTVLATLAVLGGFWAVSGPWREATFGPTRGPIMIAEAPDGWWFALLSPRLLTARGLDLFLSPQYLQRAPGASVLAVLQLVSLLAFPLAWLGGVWTVVALFRRDGRSRPATAAGTLALLTVASQIVLNGLTHTYGQPHYHNATWTAAALLIGVALDRLSAWRRGTGPAVASLLAGATAGSSLLIAVRLHTTGGTRQDPAAPLKGNYGPVLADQQRLADALGPAGLDGVDVRVPMHPESLDTLYRLRYGAFATSPGRPPARVVRYVSPEGSDDARIGLFPAEP